MKKTICITIPEELLAPAKGVAKQDNRSLSSWIASLLQEAINKKAASQGQ